MINDISEGTLRVAARVGPSEIIHDKELSRQKAETLRQERPVEDSKSGAQTEKKKKDKEGDGKYLVEGKQVVFEKYDEKGNLILRVPPSYKPVDERI
jgi:hypothetical protein